MSLPAAAVDDGMDTSVISSACLVNSSLGLTECDYLLGPQ